MTTSHQPNRGCRRGGRPGGFTLIELLVVIGIIVLLIGILVPVASKVRTSARVASTQAFLNSLSSAIERYHTEFRAYPGPLDYTQIGLTAAPGGLLNVVDGASRGSPMTRITMAENLVLGLLGGLKIDPTAAAGSNIVFDWNLVGKGASSLNPGNPKKWQPFAEAINLSWSDAQPSGGTDGPGPESGFYGDDAWSDRATRGANARDSAIPEFVDTFPEPMPVLYLRARAGQSPNPATPAPDSNNVITEDTPAPSGTTPWRVGQYDISQIIGYTDWESANGPSIGVGKKAPTYIDNDAAVTPKPTLPYHGLRTVDPDSALVPNTSGKNYDYPYDAYAYFLNQAASSAQPQPKQKDGYILIAPGPDRIYGTNDDIASFGNITD